MLSVVALFKILWHFRKHGFYRLMGALRSKFHTKWCFFGTTHPSQTEQGHLSVYELIAVEFSGV